MTEIRDTRDTTAHGRLHADQPDNQHLAPDHTDQWDAIVIGGGAAGLSAALMLGRSRRRVLVVDAGEPRNRFAAHMHGVLGDDGTSPAELLRRGREELSAYDVTIRPGVVTGVENIDPDDDEAGLTVRFADAPPASTRALILATGMTDGLPDIPGVRDFWGSGVLHCPYCHGWEVRGRRLAVLGTSEMSLHQAQLVRQWSDDLVVFTAALHEPETGEIDPEVAERLRSRGVRLVDTPVVEVQSRDGELSGVRLADGSDIELDAIFVASEARPHDALVAHFDLDRASNPMGSFLATDMTGRTSHPRIWAAGNVANPGATVPVSMSAGSMAGGMVNMALVTEEFDRAAQSNGGSTGGSAAPASATEAAAPASAPEAAAPASAPEAAALASADATEAAASPAEHWEGEYSEGRVRWSGNVNASTAAVVNTLEAGDVLELGCGEGGDAVWFAEHGWRVTAVDISPTATARGAEAAAARGVAENIEWVAHDLTTWETDQHFDLVTASFFHSKVELQRIEILRRAAGRLRPGGHLLLVTHVFETEDDIPTWGREASRENAHAHGHTDHGHGDHGHGHGAHSHGAHSHGDHGHGHGDHGHGDHDHGHEDAKSHGHSAHTMPTPTEELEQLALDPAHWEVVREEIRPREMTSPDGTQTATIKDGVLLLRLRG